MQLTHYGNALRSHFGGIVPKAKQLGLATVEIGGSAGLLSFLAAYTRARNISVGSVVKNGEIFGVPFSLAGALIASGLGLTDVLGRRASPHLLNMAVGGFAAWATAQGVKLGYRGTTAPVSVGYDQLPPGYNYYGGQGGYIGAIPQTEKLFREAGI